MTSSIWQLIYIITLASGPAVDTQSQPLTYPRTEIAFEAPADWQGCYNQKVYAAYYRKYLLEAQGYHVVSITTTCRPMEIHR